MSLDQISSMQIFISGANSLASETTTPEDTPVSTTDQIAAWLRKPVSSQTAIEATRARNAEVLNKFLQK